MTEWQIFQGQLPEAIKTLGAVPVHHADAWWSRQGETILMAGTPPASVFPSGRWVAVRSVPAGTTFNSPVQKGGYVVAVSSNGHFVRISHSGSKTQSLYAKEIVPLVFRGLGAVDDSATTVSTGQAVVAYFKANPCTQDSVQVVTDFQNAWNAANPDDALQVDGEYGPLTQGALQNALGTTNVPQNCFGGAITPPAPAPTPPLPAPSPSPSPSPSSSGGNGPLPYLIGAVVVAGALAAYTYSRKKKGH